MITIIDYGAGNLFSVKKALEYFNAKVQITDDTKIILRSDGIVLPGVGAFGSSMNLLEKSGLKDAILEATKKGIPLLGVCLGLQLLFEESEESPGTKGLGVIKGKVKRFPGDLPLPHIGWNQIRIIKEDVIFKGIKQDSFFYFVHSYYAEPCKKDSIIGITEYGIEFPSAIAQDNIFAVQFHPEKSGFEGLKIYRNFLRVIYGSNTSH